MVDVDIVIFYVLLERYKIYFIILEVNLNILISWLYKTLNALNARNVLICVL